jgi:hypothetical protein
MKTHHRHIAAAALALLTACSAFAQATLYAIGDLPGDDLFYSEVRDVVKVGGVLHAVGSSSTRNANGSTAFYWTSTGGIVALPDLVTNTGGTTPIIASAITPDAAYIAARARSAASGNARQSVRYDTTSLATPLSLGGPAGGGTGAVALSDSGNILYGFAPLDGATRAFRYTVSGSTATAIDLLAGMTHNNFTARATSADGSIALGNAGTSATLSGPGTQAFVWDNGVAPIDFLPGGTWNQSLALNNAATIGLFAGDSTAYSGSSSEAYLIANDTVIALGAPGTGLRPNIFGGITEDGAVVALTWFNASDNSSAGSFIYNSSGWHNFATIAASSGANLTGWSDFVLSAISADGTLVWGSGLHNGNTEGFIMEFSSGYLAAIPEPSTYALLAGAAALGLAAWRRRHSTAPRSAQT